MERQRQTVDEIVSSLSLITSSWEDEHARAVRTVIAAIPDDSPPTLATLSLILNSNFRAGMTVFGLVLGLSKDEFTYALKGALGPGGHGLRRYQRDKPGFVAALVELGVLHSLSGLISEPVTWRTILLERLKGGRGSAIKGQRRGRFLEDFTEAIITEVFGPDGFQVRCRFKGARGDSTEKADFAIPAAGDPQILIETKAYGATGSKQTDVLGDIGRIVEQKRHDTHLLLVTDGMSWKARLNDLRKLVEMQNRGLITRIYTCGMAEALHADLMSLKSFHKL